MKDLPLYDYREALRPSTRFNPAEEEEFEEENQLRPIVLGFFEREDPHTHAELHVMRAPPAREAPVLGRIRTSGSLVGVAHLRAHPFIL